ncbi:MAG: PQQ-binding-like beta-propeller repeat protein [Magnetococcus sp. YQC-5]
MARRPKSDILPVLSYWVLIGLFLSGCAVPTWLGGKGDDKGGGKGGEKTTQFQVPDPGQPTGLRQVWHQRVGSKPDAHFMHPAQFIVTQEAVYAGTFQGRVLSINPKDGQTQWSVETGATIMGGVAVDGQRVYAGNEQGEVFALERTSGKELWRIRVSTAVDSAPGLADDKLVVLTLDNRAYALDGKTGHRIWVHSTPAESLVVMGSATPVAADGLVFLGYSSGEVFALNSGTGQRVWSDNLRILGGTGELDLMQDVDAAVVLSEQQGPQVTPRRAFVVNHQGRMMACFAATGMRIWERRLSVLRQPLWSKGRLFIADMEGNLVALSGDDGVELWRVRLSDGLLSSPVIFKDRILVADDQSRLFALDPTSGRILGRDRLSGPIVSLPVATDEGLYLLTNSGELSRYE